LREVPKFVWLVAALVGASIVIGGVVWLTDGDSTSSEEKAELEASIRHRLPRELKRIGVDHTSTQAVSCVSSSGDRYECIARVRREGLARTVSMLIDASCGGGECTWHSVADGAQADLEGPDPAAVEEVLEEARQASGKEAPALDEPRYGWSQMTCREVEQAARGRDAEWLGEAGYAVAYRAVTELPNVKAKRLVTRAGRVLIAICHKATNPEFHPFESAEIAFLSGEGP